MRVCKMIPLGLLNAGEKAEVLEIREGKQGNGTNGAVAAKAERGEHISRMEDMGLRVGKKIEMLNNGGGGAMLIKVDESRIAIGRGIAMKVIVRRQE